MKPFATNWHLYKQLLTPLFTKDENHNRSLRVKKGKENSSPEGKVEKKTTSFEELLLEAIDEGLSLLGETAKQAVYFHLEKTFKINRQDIPHKIEEFTDALEKIFGDGAKILEIQIMKCIYKKVGFTFKHHPKKTNIEFTEYIAAVKLAKKNQENIKEQQLNPKRKQNGKKDIRAKMLVRFPNPANWICKNLSQVTMF